MKAMSVTLPLLLLLPAPAALADAPGDLLARYEARAGGRGDPARGALFYGARHGGEWSCATCHQENPALPGQHVLTEKTLRPLAPAANPLAFRQEHAAETWFRRNCNDVLRRPCSAQEKADLLAWLLTLPGKRP